MEPGDYMDYVYKEPITNASIRLRLRALEGRLQQNLISYAEYLAHKHRLYELHIENSL